MIDAYIAIKKETYEIHQNADKLITSVDYIAPIDIIWFW
jgi:hypothetical protein